MIKLTMLLAMGLAVVVTANHFILDVLVGALVALTGLAIAHLVQGHGQRFWAWLVARVAKPPGRAESAGA